MCCSRTFAISKQQLPIYPVGIISLRLRGEIKGKLVLGRNFNLQLVLSLDLECTPNVPLKESMSSFKDLVVPMNASHSCILACAQ